jgi:glycosyltransferase involved in cell wall biosynthesis
VSKRAYNESVRCEIIEQKFENSYALEYPDEKIRSIVDDGSTDGTDEIVRSYASQDVELFHVEGRVGKTTCQNELVATVDEEFVVFSDADSMYEPDAVSQFVERFEPGVGYVVGNSEHREEGRIAGEYIYWRFEQFLKRLDARCQRLLPALVRSTQSAGRRTSRCRPMRSATSRCRSQFERDENVAYAPGDVAWERMSGDVGLELQRRLRIATRIWRTGIRRRALFNPARRPLVAYQLLSHRGLLVLAPLAALGLFAATLTLAATDGGVFVHGLLAFKGSFGLLAGVGAVAHTTGR